MSHSIPITKFCTAKNVHTLPTSKQITDAFNHSESNAMNGKLANTLHNVANIEQETHSIKSKHPAPMKPILLNHWVARKIQGNNLNIQPDTFFMLTENHIQVAFKFYSLSSMDEMDVDEIRTCSWFTTISTQIAIFDCGDDSDADRNYISRNCHLLDNGEQKTFACSNASHQRRWAGKLTPGRPYYAIISGQQVGHIRPRFSVVHFKRRLRQRIHS